MPRYEDDDCEDQALVATKTCTTCIVDWTDDRPVYAPLVKRGQFWCCSHCGSSYGAHPHPDLR